MAILLDTSILGRLANSSDPLFAIADGALSRLRLRGEVLHLTPQNYVEFWNVATRPVAVNGLGLTPAETKFKADVFAASFPLLDDNPAIFPAWLALVDALGVIGKQVHDARLAACCHVHGIDAILTFNVPHFARFSTFGPALRVLDPATV